MTLTHDGVLFTAWSVLGSFGSGFGPSVSSVATTLYTRNGGKELGKLFGALSVVQIVWCVMPRVPRVRYSCARLTGDGGLVRRSSGHSCMD